MIHPDYYITPIERSSEELVVWAGLSWVPPPTRGYLTWDISTDIEVPTDARVVAVTAARHQHLKKIQAQKAVRPDTLWIIGGPATKALDADILFGGGEYSSEQILSVPDTGQQKSWTLGIGSGCPWSGCTFCRERGRVHRRANWVDALKVALAASKPNDTLYLSPPAMFAPEVEVAARAARSSRGAIVSVAMRPEDARLTKDLRGVDVGIGLVALSDKALGVINRGHQVTDAIDAAKHASDVGAIVHVFVNTHNPDENVDEAQTTIKRLDWLRGFGVRILDVGPLLYPSIHAAQKLPATGCKVELDESSWWRRAPTQPEVQKLWESAWNEMDFTLVRETTNVDEV